VQQRPAVPEQPQQQDPPIPRNSPNTVSASSLPNTAEASRMLPSASGASIGGREAYDVTLGSTQEPQRNEDPRVALGMYVAVPAGTPAPPRQRSKAIPLPDALAGYVSATFLSPEELVPCLEGTLWETEQDHRWTMQALAALHVARAKEGSAASTDAVHIDDLDEYTQALAAHLAPQDVAVQERVSFVLQQSKGLQDGLFLKADVDLSNLEGFIGTITNASLWTTRRGDEVQVAYSAQRITFGTETESRLSSTFWDPTKVFGFLRYKSCWKLLQELEQQPVTDVPSGRPDPPESIVSMVSQESAVIRGREVFDVGPAGRPAAQPARQPAPTPQGFEAPPRGAPSEDRGQNYGYSDSAQAPEALVGFTQPAVAAPPQFSAPAQAEPARPPLPVYELPTGPAGPPRQQVAPSPPAGSPVPAPAPKAKSRARQPSPLPRSATTPLNAIIDSPKPTDDAPAPLDDVDDLPPSAPTADEVFGALGASPWSVDQSESFNITQGDMTQGEDSGQWEQAPMQSDVSQGRPRPNTAEPYPVSAPPSQNVSLSLTPPRPTPKRAATAVGFAGAKAGGRRQKPEQAQIPEGGEPPRSGGSSGSQGRTTRTGPPRFQR